MRLRDRISRLEEQIDRPRNGDGGGATTIVVRGGLPSGMCAYLPGHEEHLDAEGEPLAAFRLRAIAWAEAAGSAMVIISGVPKCIA